MSEQKIHVLPDDNLGGVLREFVEVDRKAEVGEYIFTINTKEIHKVTKCSDDGVHVGGLVYVYDEYYRTLEPTVIVHIDGQRYRMVDRKAKVGEKVMYYKDGKSDGVVTTCIGYDERFNDCIDVEPYITKDDGEETCGFADGYYRVLEPIIDHSTADMLASLAQKIVELERKIDRLGERTESNARDIETWAQEVERLKSRVKTESSVIKTFNLSDLDGRTLRIVTATDTGKENDFTTIVTFGRDVNSGEMFVLGYEVNAE